MNTAITHWGYTPSGESIYLFRLTNASGASIELTNLGASWVSAICPINMAFLKTFCWDTITLKDI